MELLHKEITSKIIGAGFEVHTFLGNGFQEVIYQRALELELRQQKLHFDREVSIPIYYKDFKDDIGTRRADFLVENKVLVELKARTEIEDVHRAQLLNYLRAFRIEVGLLFNFGAKSFEFERFVLSPKHHPQA